MTIKIIAALALSLGLGTAAIAQTSTTTTTDTTASAGTSALPMEWEGAIADAFFSDVEAGTLRTADEAKAKWAELTPEQRTHLRDNWADKETRAQSVGTASAGGYLVPEDYQAAQLAGKEVAFEVSV